MRLTPQKSFFIFLLLILPTSLYAQGALRGEITDSLTQKHLVGANVFLLGTAIGSATNLEGEYSIKPIPEGSYTVKVSYLGYKAKLVDLEIKNGLTTQYGEVPADQSTTVWI